MERLEVSGAVRPLYGSLGVRGLRVVSYIKENKTDYQYYVSNSTTYVDCGLSAHTFWNGFRMDKNWRNYSQYNKEPKSTTDPYHICRI